VKRVINEFLLLGILLISVISLGSCGKKSNDDINITPPTLQVSDTPEPTRNTVISETLELTSIPFITETPEPTSIPVNTDTPEPTLSMTEIKGGELYKEFCSIQKFRKVSDCSDWIESTTPADDAEGILADSNIRVVFSQNMDGTTLSGENIIIYEGKHDSVISQLFNYSYDKKT
jgi:hypothetical protein